MAWKLLGLLTLACALLAPARDVHAERYALLVGVSNYVLFAADPRMQLSGPKNDVPLLRALLENRGFAPSAVQVLADGVPGAAIPTRAAILGALDGLAERVKPGDYVFLYFAGHGSQMPADPDTPEGRAEIDGLHEIFLPADVGRWNGGSRRVDRAIADHELVRRLDALLTKEVFVWAVFDTCHAATLMRGVGDADVRDRRVVPSVLGIPQAAMNQAVARAQGAWPVDAQATALPGVARAAGARTRSPASGSAGFVLFYAAQTTQTTPELPLPAGEDDHKTYGLFSFALAEALSSAEGGSYRQVAQHILGRYAAQNLSTPTPLFTGSQLDAPLFGSVTEHRVRQWPIEVAKEGVTLRAGLLSQLQVGTELDILPGPLARPTQSLGAMRVSRAELMSSLLVPVQEPGEPAIDVAKLPHEAVARLVRPMQPEFALRVLAPAAVQDADARTVRQAIESIRQAPQPGIGLQWAEPGAAHDLRLHVADGRVWLLPPTGQWYDSGAQTTPSIRIRQPEFQARLADILQRVGRVQNLMRIASALKDVPAERLLQVEGTLKPAAGSPRQLDPLGAEQARDGDTLELSVRNIGRVALDLSVLYIDAAHGITALYPHPRGASNRLEPGDLDHVVARIDATTTGLERLLLIAVEARAQGESHDFSFLGQARLERSRSGAGRDDIERMFEEAGFGGDARAKAGRTRSLPAPDRTELRVFNLWVR